MKKQYYILQKYNSEVGTDGRVIEHTGKPLQVKDKYFTNVFKGYSFRAAIITANREGNRTGGRELKDKILYKYKYSLKWYFSIRANCICLVYFMLKRYISFIKLEKELKIL